MLQGIGWEEESMAPAFHGNEGYEGRYSSTAISSLNRSTFHSLVFFSFTATQIQYSIYDVSTNISVDT